MSPSLKRAFIIIGVFFFFFFIAIFYTVKTAVNNYEPPTDPAYHEKGLDYQKRIDEFERAKERGWKATINLFQSETIKAGANTLTISLEKDALKPSGDFGAADRPAVLVSISHPASIEGGKTYSFPASDFVKNGQNLKFEKQIDVPVKGVAEVSVEVRPEADSAIHISKKLAVE